MSEDRPRRENVPRNLKKYYLVLLRRGPHWNDPEGQEDLADRQLAYLRVQAEAGRYRLAGPATDGGEIAAIAVIEAMSTAEALHVAKADPAVEAGRLEVEVHPVFLPSLEDVRVIY